MLNMYKNYVPKETTVHFYLIRHAESEANANDKINNVIQGSMPETPLTPKGINQAKTLGKFLTL